MMTTPTQKPVSVPSNPEFVRLLLRHEREIYAFLYSLLGNSADADEVLQETSIVLWSNFERFQPGTDFVHWAIATAHFQVLRFRKEKQRQRVLFSDAFIEQVAAASSVELSPVGEIFQALDHCLSLLDGKARALTAARYGSNASVDEIAHDLGRPRQTVYTRLKRIRRRLMECIERYMGEGATS